MVVKYSHAINHYTALNLTKLDILDTFPVIKVAVAYKDPRTGEEIPSFPADQKLVESAEVVVSIPVPLSSKTLLPIWLAKQSQLQRSADKATFTRV